MQREGSGVSSRADVGSSRVTPGVSVGASLGDMSTPGVPREGSESHSPVIPGLVRNHPGDCRSGTAPVWKEVSETVEQCALRNDCSILIVLYLCCVHTLSYGKKVTSLGGLPPTGE